MGIAWERTSRMINWNRKFRSEYDAARDALASAAAFEPGWQAVVAQLLLLMGRDGFDTARKDALDELRRRATHGADGTRVDEADGLLRAIAPANGGDVGAFPEDARLRAAALKLLRHVHLEGQAGSRGVWIVALPTEFDNWPSCQFADEAGNLAGVRQLLAGGSEHFDAEQRRYLGAATLQGLAWCQRAAIVLADARRPRASASRVDARADTRAHARALVRRWFAEAGASEAAIDRLVATLTNGFKDIVATLNRGRFIITDWVPFRASRGADEVEFLRTEAFAFRSRSEGMDVVYVESAFFSDFAGNVLRGQANWTRILVHELSHLVCGTQDVNDGHPRYAWSGIGPHAGYPSTATIRNADNWAFFAADCAGALMAGQRATALRQA
jgi:hypothetical protein